MSMALIVIKRISTQRHFENFKILFDLVKAKVAHLYKVARQGLTRSICVSIYAYVCMFIYIHIYIYIYAYL